MSRQGKAVSITTKAMWCESCNQMTLSTRTTLRIMKNGDEVQKEKCSECGSTQETMFFKGPSVRIKNKGK